MATSRLSMTRAQVDDEIARLSNNVEGGADDSGSDNPSASTPPTSISDKRSMQSSAAPEDVTKAADNLSTRRPKRARSSVGSYNLQQLSNAQLPEPPTGSRNPSGLSGRTLVNKNTNPRVENGDESSDDEVASKPRKSKRSPAKPEEAELPPRPTRKPSIRDRVMNGVRNATGSMRSVLGKRSRDTTQPINRKRASFKEEEEIDSPQKNKLLKELDMGKRGVLDELDLDEDYDVPAASRPAKRVKTSGKSVVQAIAEPLTSGPMQKTSDGKAVKKWQREGLYVGQDLGGPKKLKKKRPGSSTSDAGETSMKQQPPFVPLPMFSYLDKERDFVIPFDVFAPSLRKGDEKPKDWHKVNRNRLVGEAKELWHQSENLPHSPCVCRLVNGEDYGCQDDCLNRVMQYECNKDNCNLPFDRCGNRPFAELSLRLKKGGSYDIGVEVIKTAQRGFGIRACRSFRPGAIIMEYTGEIISEAECQRRMREDYKDKACYYLMELERNLVIDGTKGSMARFINHSCSPNCEVRMLKVNGTPRMAVFAGDSGVMTAEELTYDYNFDNFGETRQPCYCGAKNCRGYLGKRLNAAEQKKWAKEEQERKRKAAEEAQKAAEEEQRKKRVKLERPGWAGWVAVDDPEVKARLREEKRLKEEAEANSTRARRLAARRNSTPAQPPVSASPKKKASPRRRKTIASREDLQRPTTADSKDTESDAEGEAIPKTRKQLRRTSTGSRFTEDLDLEQRPASRPGSRPGSKHSGRIFKKTTYSVKSSMEIQRERIAEDEDTTAGAALIEQLSGHGGSNLSKVSSRLADAMEIDDSEDDEEQNAKQNEKEKDHAAAKAKRGSIYETATKWKQSTLNFIRKS